MKNIEKLFSENYFEESWSENADLSAIDREVF